MAFYSDLINLNPRDANNYKHRGMIYGWLGRSDAMLADERKAVEVAPQNSELQASLANFYLSSTFVQLRDRKRGLEHARVPSNSNHGTRSITVS